MSIIEGLVSIVNALVTLLMVIVMFAAVSSPFWVPFLIVWLIFRD